MAPSRVDALRHKFVQAVQKCVTEFITCADGPASEEEIVVAVETGLLEVLLDRYRVTRLGSADKLGPESVEAVLQGIAQALSQVAAELDSKGEYVFTVARRRRRPYKRRGRQRKHTDAL